MSKQRILGVIPARGGSKRLPRKNILSLNGKPLISYTINAALESSCIDEVVVSSDDKEILELSSSLGAQALLRPDNLASDTASTFDVVKQVVESYPEYTHIALLQPTSPLRTAKHIDEAAALMVEKQANAVISVCEMEHSPLWSNRLDASLSMENFLREEVINKRSQDLDVYYRLNGAIYLVRIDRLLAERSFLLKKDIFAYIMDRWDSVDIDEAIDFEIAGLLLSKR